MSLMLFAASCGASSNNPNGISTGGTGANGGGGTSIAGRGGTAGAGIDAADSGSTAAAGDSNDAGAPDASGTMGSGGRPAGCPEPTPIPAEGQTIVIQSVNTDTSEIVLRNATSTPQAIALGRQGWQWCAYPRYWSFTDENTTIELAPEETYSFVAIYNQSGPLALFPDEGEMAIYSLPGVFEEYEYMEAFVAWGEVEAFRESYAVQNKLWTFGQRVEVAPGDVGFIVTGETDRASGYTSVPARCLVP